MKKILACVSVILTLIFTNLVKASDDSVVTLEHTQTLKLVAPKTSDEILKTKINMAGEKSTEEEFTGMFIPEQDISESKLEQSFYKFIDKKVINNKVNQFTTKFAN